MELPNFFKKIKKETPEITPKENLPEQGIEEEKKAEIINRWQGRRTEKLKQILFSKKADTLLNYVPGLDFTKMPIEAIVGKTLSGRELRSAERIAYVLAGALILGFYITRNPIVRLGASAVFDAIMLPRMFKMAMSKVGEITPQLGSVLGGSYHFIMQHRTEFVKALADTLEGLRI